MKVLGKLPVPGRPTNLDYSRARAYCACSRCGWGLFSLIYHFSFLSPSLWETARYRLKYCLKGPLSPKQPTNLNSVSVLHVLSSSNRFAGGRLFTVNNLPPVKSNTYHPFSRWNRKACRYLREILT